VSAAWQPRRDATCRGADCASDFRYELFVDQGALVAVNLVLTDP